jgi:hypothetical protein
MKGKQLKEKGTSSLPNLNKEIKIMWTTGITPDYCKRLRNSMPRRIQQVVAAKREATKY